MTQDYEYDAVGNLIRDTHGREFTFNGDNKQVEVTDAQNVTVGEYLYDGSGKRIKKITNTEYVIFVYDGLGKLIGEYSTDGPLPNPNVSYTATDPLGSPRAITNKQGEIVSRRDFMPFGEEIASDTTYRIAALKYGVDDSVRQKFTGYEHDEETGLDFAEARYYYNNHGRFTAVDPLLASGKSGDPQTFNRYAYTMNRPLNLTDPTGLQAGTPKPGEPGSDENPIRVETRACGFFCRAFNQLVRVFIGNRGVEYRDAEEDFAERKRTGVDKDVRNTIMNSANDLNTVTEVAVQNDPTGILNLQKAVVKNSLGRASDEEVYQAMGGAAFNTAATIIPVGKAFQIAKAGGKHSGLIVNYASRTDGQILKAIKSLGSGKRGIDVHLDKIANPSKYVKNWDKLTKEHQQTQINNWRREVVRNAEEIDVLRGILGER